MARNDTILIDGIIDDRVAERLPSDRRDEAFEYFAFEQILRDADLSQDEIKAGWIDGRDDGGIDGLFVLVNGHPLLDVESFIWPRSGSELDLWIITCKHHDTFRQAPIDNLVASISELFDFAVPNGDLKGAYSQSLVNARAALIHAYRKVSPRLTRFTVHFVYASRGDTGQIGASIRSRADQAVGISKEFFGNCDACFEFAGASELIASHRRVRAFSLELPFLEALARGERYALLCRLADFYAFVVDESGKLRRYLFDSNVRAFMGLNRVNEDIRATLDEANSPDFWWLNNGVTILANTAVVTGKSIHLEGVQIVNGLQTTESIAHYFADGHTDPQGRAILIKIVVSRDSDVRDLIIRATNNQTGVEPASLHATDKIQRDIEEVLLRSGFFYERRTKYYANQGQPASLIVAPLYIASGYVNLVLKSPALASRLKARHIRSEESYSKIFSEDAPIHVWPAIAGILKTTDAVLETVRPRGTTANERFLKNWRQITALIATARQLGRFTFNANDLVALPKDALSKEMLISTWEFVRPRAGMKLDKKGRSRKGLATELCRQAATTFAIGGVEVVERVTARSPKASGSPRGESVSSAFVERVNIALPTQPWKVGIHREIAIQLQCNPRAVSAAISQLIASGARNRQEDGVVFAPDGSVLAYDPDRALPADDDRRV
jgi:hypothetical protein